MFDRKISVPRPNIFIVIIVAVWLGILLYSTIEMSDSHIDSNITVMSAVATALLILAALPLAAVIHYTRKNDRFKQVTRGLLWFVILIIASDVAVYVVPDSSGIPCAEQIGQMLYLGACFAILVPVGLAETRRESESKIDVVLTAAGIAIVTLVGYMILAGISKGRLNGSLIAWSAAYVAIESVVAIVLTMQIFQDLPKDIKNLYILLIVYFVLEAAGDAVNMYYILQLHTPQAIGYISRVSITLFSAADVFLTAALGIYSWKTINPFNLKMVSDKLIETRRMMNDLIGQSPDAICIYSPEGNAVTANEAFYRIHGVSPDEVTAKFNIFDRMRIMGIPEEDAARLKSGETVVVEDLFYPPTGLHLMVKIYPTHSEGGTISGYISSFEDITEWVRSDERVRSSLEEKSVLLKEIHHRVKNNLQIISSLLSLQSTYIADPVAMGYFKDSQNRVKSMALVHERLYQSENLSRVNFTEYVNSLAMFLFRSYNTGAGKVRLNVEAESVFINIDKAISCGLIINELVTNSLKYAFPGDRKGVITVRMSVVNGKCVMMIGDDGVGIPESTDFRKTTTLGMQLIVTLTSQLEGTIELDRSSGTRFTISFPV